MGPRTLRTGRLWLAAAAGLLAAAAPLAAQGGTVAGTVTQASSGRPLAGARVQVVGSELAAVTNAGGEYRIAGVPAGAAQLRASVLGHATATRSVTVADGREAHADFVLTEQALSLNAVVVTGTPAATTRRTLGNSITKVNAEEVTANTNVVDVAEILQGRSPGVQVVPNAGTPGAAPDIRIRGATSFIGNQPVVLVDGVRFETGSLGNFSPGGAGLTPNNNFQATSALSWLNPEDIESIEVIKGPAAATLYGAEAANGVIQIITKKGARGQQRPQWEFRIERGRTDLALDLPTNFTTCDSVKQADAATWPGCQGVPRNTILTDNPMRRDPTALREGNAGRFSASVRGGGDRYSYYVAGDLSQDQGVFYNSFSNSKSARANFSINPSSVLDFQVNTSYLLGDLRLPLGDESANGLLLSAARGRPGRVPPAGDPLRVGWATVAPYQSNAYNNRTHSDRLTLSGTANYRPWEWFRNRLTVGLDMLSSLAELLSEPNSADTPAGLSAQRVPRSHIYTVDYAGNLLHDFGERLTATTSFGLQLTSKQYQTLFASGTGLGAPDVTLIQTAQTISASNTFSEQRSLGLFAQEQLAWSDRLFVTGALRMDNNSAFGSRIHRLLYPKASLSWVLSEEPALSGFFENIHAGTFKFRTAWGEAGRAPDPYSAT
ncbi:MAG TPA: TonB-dependent receptor, partial [Longimicrobiaceae bacterium]